MNRKIRLLFYTELWANAGIESVIMSLFRNFDLSKIQVDIMASQNISDFYDEEIKRLGGRKIITLVGVYSSPAQRMAANRGAFEKALKENKYDIVHIHMCNAAAMMYGKIAKQLGVPVVVYHSHNTNIGTKHRWLKTMVHNIAKARYEKYADILMSCSDLASKWMFTKKAIDQGSVVLVKNAIDLDKFEFNPEKREQVRKELGVIDQFVVGHIGRFAVAKNHPFLVKVFAEIHKIQPNSKLLLIGEGEDEPVIREQVSSMGLDDSVIFYGTTNKIPQILWAMDAFVLPSFFEGNPVVGIEAQAASTPCFFADTITKMCNITGDVQYLSLEEAPSMWANTVVNARGTIRVSNAVKMKEAGYSIYEIAQRVQKQYEQVLLKKD